MTYSFGPLSQPLHHESTPIKRDKNCSVWEAIRQNQRQKILQWHNYGGREGGTGGHMPPSRGLCPPGALVQHFEKIGPHLRLQDAKCSSIDMPP